MTSEERARVPDRAPLLGGPLPATLLNLVRNAARPGYLQVMVSKLVSRMTDRSHAAAADEAVAWASDRARGADEVAQSIDASLWEEATEFGVRLEANAGARIEGLREDPHQGGGHCTLLYFLVRWMKPEIAVETGVALGFSTAAILSAMRVNGIGHLYSSDFPAFKLREPERHIGCMVDDHLRERWTLDLRGDRRGIARILREVDGIDLLHYDSDKTYRGRQMVLERTEARLATDALVIMDDIQENLFFRDYTGNRGCRSEVVGYEGKYLGIVGL